MLSWQHHPPSTRGEGSPELRAAGQAGAIPMSPQAAWGAPVPTLIPPSGKSSKEREPPVSTVAQRLCRGQGPSPNPCWHFMGSESPQCYGECTVQRNTHPSAGTTGSMTERFLLFVWQCWRQGIRPRQVFNWNGNYRGDKIQPSFGVKKEAGGSGKKALQVSDYWNSKSLHCNLT